MSRRSPPELRVMSGGRRWWRLARPAREALEAWVVVLAQEGFDGR